jgi:predicted membrane metal-binding protein
MSEIESHSEIEVSSDAGFGFVFAAFFAIIGLLPLISAAPVRIWALILSAAFLLVALIVPRILRPLNILWFKLGMLLSRIVTPIVMFLIFFVAVLPTAIVVRAMGRDAMARKTDRAAKSYWIVRDNHSDAEPSSMKNQF